MIRRVVVMLVMSAIAAWCALNWAPPQALAIWSGIAAALCSLGALLMSRQPIGVATFLGQVGSGFLPWGYKVGRGKLLPIVVVSWFLWTLLGAAVIAVTTLRGQPQTQWMILAWTIDGLALLFLVGRMATNSPRTRPALLIPIAIVLGMIGGSVMLWLAGTASARGTALLIAGAPIPTMAAAYGLLLAAMTLGGRKGGWR